MKIITFTIKGNQENPSGNPIPYTRTTQGSVWSDKSARYQKWKSYVVSKYIKALESLGNAERNTLVEEHDLNKLKPIKDNKRRSHMKIMIYFCNKAHPDSDNVFKGIADSLFANDKYLSGEFYFDYAKEGYVEVTIQFL